MPLYKANNAIELKAKQPRNGSCGETVFVKIISFKG